MSSLVAHRPVRPAGERRRTGQTGSSLMLAVAFLGIILTLVTFLFGLADTGTKSVRSYRTDRTIHYAADSALEEAVQRLKANPTMGTTASPGCDMTSDIVQMMPGSSGPAPLYSLTSNSFLNVTCAPTPGSQSGENDVDGYPKARDVNITVTCKTSNALVDEAGIGSNLADCGHGSTNRIVAKARVRFEVDYAYTGLCVSPFPACPQTDRARIPKIVNWDILR